MRSSLVLSVVIALTTTTLTGCSKSKKATRTPVTVADERLAAGGGDDDASSTARGPDRAARPEGPASFGPIYFEHDATELSTEARTELERLARWLRGRGDVKLTIAGHADERGTPEYNVALGEARARVIREYLVRLGANAAIDIISYGEERPVVQGGGEESWARNRRGEIEVRSGGRAGR